MEPPGEADPGHLNQGDHGKAARGRGLGAAVKQKLYSGRGEEAIAAGESPASDSGLETHLCSAVQGKGGRGRAGRLTELRWH